ncbi:MAG: hypothetical protein Q9163_004747 [Psora crenata]
MDINSLLSPQEAPRATPTPSGKGSAKKPRKARNSPLDNCTHAAGSTASPPTLPGSTGGQTQKMAPSSTVPSPTSGALVSVTSASTIEGTRSFRQPSTPGMDTLADLASMQHHQQTARANAGGLRSAEIYDGQVSAANNLHPHQPITRSEATSRLRADSFDIGMAEAQHQTPPPRTYFSVSLSDADLHKITHAANDITQNPFAYESLVQFINLLHKGLLNHVRLQSSSKGFGDPHSYELLNDLQSARENMSSRYAMGEDLWADWIQDQILLASHFEDKLLIRELCEKAANEEPNSTKIWLVYGQWMLSEHHKTTVSDERVSANGTSIPGSLSAEEERAMAAEVFNWQQVLGVWRRGAHETMWRINDSHQLWNQYTELLLQDLGPLPQPEAIAQMRDWFIKRLRTPHATWDQTSQRLSTFLSTFDNANWETTMVTITRLDHGAKHKYEMRDFKEIKVLRATQKGDQEAELEAFNKYIDYELNLSRKKNAYSFNLTNAIFQRATLRFPARTDLWEGYIMFLNEEITHHGKRDISILPVLEKATRHCPWSGQLWSQFFLAAEIAQVPFTDISEIKHKATSTGLLDIGDMDEVLKVTTAWCGFLRRRAFMPGSTDEDMDVAEVGIRSAIEDLETLGRKKYGKDYQGDPEYRLERIYIKYLTQCRNWGAARDTFKKLIPKKGHDYDFWMRYYIWEMTTWCKLNYNEGNPDKGRRVKPSEATRVLQQALRRPDLNWPEKLLETYLYHCEDHEDAQQLQSAVAEIYKQNKIVRKRREKEALEQYQLQIEQQQQQLAPQDVFATTLEDSERPGKRKRDGESGEAPSKKSRPEGAEVAEQEEVQEQDLPAPSLPKRDRENTTVIVRNLPAATTNVKLRQYFRDCGQINSLKILPEADGRSATACIEFQSKEDVLTAQTKDMKTFDGRDINVEIGSGATLYVCNFPPTADESWIRGKFKQFGEIVDVRFPSLKYNTHRRFAYVQFRLPSQAHAATKLDGEKLGDDLELVAKISDPAQKQDRHGAMYEGRELFVVNIPWSATWKDLKQLFSEYGNVESARVLRKVNGSSKGMGYVVFRRKEDAIKGLAMNLKDWKGRVLNVTFSTNDTTQRKASVIILNSQHASPSPAPNDHTTNGDIQSEFSPAPPASNGKEDIQSRTLALMNIPDTVNDARIRTLAEPFGELVRVVLRPDHQGAIIEYTTQASAGKASLALQGHEVSPGRAIAVGSVAEMKLLRAEKRNDKIETDPEKTGAALHASAVVRRPRQITGRRGGRGGLGLQRGGVGLSGARAFKDGEGKEGEAEGNQIREGNARSKPKSNADFKAMIGGDIHALDLLLSLLSSGALPPSELPAVVAPPQFIAFISTLTVHPVLTTRAKSSDRVQAANLAWKYLRLIGTSVGPIGGNLAEAFSFSALDALSRGGRREKRKINDADSPEKAYNLTIENDLASVGSLWARGDDLWHVVGWAFNCSVLHKRRWEVWRAWLEYMLDVLEADWDLRSIEHLGSPLRQSMIVRYICGEGTTAGNERRILRAIFADGQARSRNEFREIWPNETKELKKEGDGGKVEKMRIDIDADDYGDYYMGDDDELDADLEDSPEASTPPRSRSPTKRTRHNNAFNDTGTDTDTDTSKGAELLGGLHSISLRLRLLSLLSKVAYYLPDQFIPSKSLYHLYLDYLRPLPLPTFFLIISPAGLRPFALEAASSLTQFILRTIISPTAPAPPTDDLTQDTLLQCYLPFAANKANMVDNAKVSLCLETLVRLLEFYTYAGLQWTPQLQEAMDKGITDRRMKVRKFDADDMWLDGSAARIRTVVGLAKRRETGGG